MANQNQTRTNRSATALGVGYRQWTRIDLIVILNHYSVHYAPRDTKHVLMDLVNQLAAQRGLAHRDRLAIIRAHKAGLRLPPCKPLIRGSVTAPIPAQIAEPFPTNDQTGEYPSGASDGSDVEMSDGELAEELPSLSEEERDLREYTATMSTQRSSEQRRSVGQLPVATPISNRSIPTARSAALNRPVPADALATTRTRVPLNRPRPALAAVHRPGPMITPRSRVLTRPQSSILGSSTQSANRPNTVQTTENVASECVICYNSYDLDKILLCQPTASCKHELNVCKPCLSDSISSQLDNKRWNRIDCPAPDCGELLEYRDIQAYADPQTFTRYFEFTFQAAQADGIFQRCRTPGCHSGQQCFPEDSIMHCQQCLKSTCINCDIEMHHGISCEEKAAEREAVQQHQDPHTAKYLGKRAKKCPGCAAPTQKTGGCDHITCEACDYEYCWLCLADYGPIREEGNEHHAPGCKYHSENL